jgi:crotonobetainyl-CoA:carnitine CoA-transferase CaiB-like acyl-CoA transferase
VLQGAGVHAYPVNDVAQLFRDEQLVFRRIWRRREHAEIGAQAYCFPGFDLCATPGEITKAAPLLGEDNERVLREFAGLDPVEYAACAAGGGFD